MIELSVAHQFKSDEEITLTPTVLESDFSDNYSESTLSRCNSLERLKIQEGFVEENFRVDRRKLEAMILGCPPDPWDTEVMKIPIDENGRVKSASAFFDEIMESTSTIIKFPKCLKIGAKNKKDPHVRVIGKPEGVSDASRQIRLELQPNNRITMKVDVPWNCHSHIIGKGGNTIQPVVKRTGVSIHFPDGNKNSDTNKSNQVSINSRGQELSGLEEARAAIRLLNPLMFTFSLPASAQFISISDTSILVLQVQNMYNVQAELKLFNEMLVGSVKGTEWDAARVKEATLFLLQSLCGNLATQMAVQITMEISPQHHSIILGRSSENVRKIMNSTATKITFPDGSDPKLPPLNRSTVKIAGGIENAYVAKEKIIGSLPLVLMFDVPCGETSVDQKDLNQVMQTLDVLIITRCKRSDGRQPIIIRGAERNAAHIYEAWRIISKSEKSPKAKIPQNYSLEPTSPFDDVMGYLTGRPSMNLLSGNLYEQCIHPTKYCIGNCSPCTDLLPNENGTLDCCPYPETVRKCESLPSPNDQVEQTFPQEDIKQLSELESLLSVIPDRRAPGCEKKHGFISDLVLKKIIANHVMKKPVLPEPRTPTSDWFGFGLSKSQPSYPVSSIIRDRRDLRNEWTDVISRSDSDSSTHSGLNDDCSNEMQDRMVERSYNIDYTLLPKNIDKTMSNYIDSLHTNRSFTTAQLPKDLNSLLAYLQLEKYIDLFASQDVNYDMFCQLNDQDLKDLGVTVFGHRRKLLTIIKELSLQRKSRS